VGQQRQELIALRFVVGAEQFLSLVDRENERGRVRIGITDSALLELLRRGPNHKPTEVGGGRRGVLYRQLRADFTWTDRMRRTR
jgi:hypothetical protein